MVRRLVGYWEYLKALQNLDQLARTLSEAERDELNEFISQRNLFAVDMNLSQDLQSENSTLTDPPDAAKEQRGLSWMTALARVELASMLSGYTKVPRPFEAVQPTAHDVDAYRYLLLDGLRSHYWSLKNDRSIDYLLGSKNIYNVLAYSRRMVMVRSMLSTLVRSGRQWSFPEQQELTTWKRDLDELYGMLTTYVHKYMTKYVGSGTKTTTHASSRYLTRICASILSGAQQELANGTATQTSQVISEGNYGVSADGPSGEEE